MKIANNIIELVGRTPMVRLNRLTEGIDCEVIVKLESQNPGGSVKDRLGFAMIEAAERDGLINQNTTIIEPTSGNTGVGLAFVCAAKGYKLKIVMPDSVSIERRMIIQAYGTEVVLTPGKDGMKGAIAKAEEIRDNTPGGIFPSNSLILPIRRCTAKQPPMKYGTIPKAGSISSWPELERGEPLRACRR